MRKEFRNKILSVMIAFAFVFTVFAAVSDSSEATISTSGSGTQADPYEIALFVGSSFSYTPTFSLSNVTLAKNANSTNAGWITVDASSHAVTGTVTSEAEAAGDTTLILTATHSGGIEGTPVVQTADMYIHFTLYKRIALSTSAPTPNYVLIDGSDFSRTVSVITENAANFTPSYTITIGSTSYTTSTMPSWLSISYAAATATTGTVTISADASEITSEFQNKMVSVIVNGADSTSGDQTTSAGQCEVAFYVYEELTVSPAATIINQVEGTNFTPIDYTVTNDNSPAVSWTIASQTKNTAADTSFAIGSANGQLTRSGAFGTPDSTTDHPEYDLYEVTVQASATAYTSTANATVKVYVWKELVFTNTPSSGSIEANKTNAFAITAKNSTAGSAYTVWDFGDGSVVKSYDNAVSHTYATSGMFKVKQTSYDANGVAFQPTYYLVEVGDGIGDALNDAKEDVKGFFEEHGYGVLIFGILAAILFFLGYVVIGDMRLVYGAAVSAIVAVILFFAKIEIFGLLL